jgi:hypothetical protein
MRRPRRYHRGLLRPCTCRRWPASSPAPPPRRTTNGSGARGKATSRLSSRWPAVAFIGKSRAPRLSLSYAPDCRQQSRRHLRRSPEQRMRCRGQLIRDKAGTFRTTAAGAGAIRAVEGPVEPTPAWIRPVNCL